MILTRKAYRGHYIEIRSEHGVSIPNPSRHAQVWVDGEAMEAPQPCRDTHDLDRLLDQARSHIDALHA